MRFGPLKAAGRVPVLGALALAATLLVPGPARAERFSLEQLYRLALERNERVRVAREQVFQAKRDRDRAVSQILPRLAIEGTYQRYAAEKLGRFGTSAFVLLPESESSLQVVLRQPLFSGGRLRSGLRIARAGIQASRQDARVVREELLLRVGEAAYAVLKARRDVEIAEMSVRQLEEHRRVAALRFQVGELTRVALLRAEAELAGAKASRIRAREALETAREALRRLVDLPEPFVLEEPREPDYTPPSLEELLRLARTHRAELARSRWARKIAEENVALARSRFLPDLSLEGVYVRQDQNPRSPFFLEEVAYAGVRLTFPVFEGGLRRAELRQARSRLVQASLEARALEKRIQEEVRRARAAWVQLTASLEALRKQVAYAREGYAMAQKLFRHGLAAPLDVLDAHTRLIAAERDLAHTTYDRHVAVLRLQRSIGRLSEHLGLAPENENRP